MYDRDDLPAALSGDGAGDGPLDALLGDDERLQYVLSSGDALEHTTSGRTTTVEPGGSHDAYMLVTDERVLFVFGDRPRQAEISFDLADVRKANIRSGLLSSKIVVGVHEESVLFVPSGGDYEEAMSYVERIGKCWSDLEEALVGVEEALDDLTDAIQGEGDEEDIRLRAQSRLSKANHAATREDDAPTEKILDRIRPYRARLENTQIYAWLDRADTDIEEAREALENDEFVTACEEVADAGESIERVGNSIEEMDDPPQDAVDRLAALEDAVGALTEDILDAADRHCEAAGDADDPDQAIEAWSSARERYTSALEADWNGQVGVSRDALEFQLAWVGGNLVRTLESRAEILENEGDDLGEDSDEAGDRYEEAIDYLERARDLADDVPACDPETFTADIDRLEDKVGRTEWQWGNA